MNNAIGLIEEDMQRHKVLVKLPNEKEERSLYLILITAKTSKLKDLKKTYGDKVTTTHLKIAKKIFGEGESENIYGVLVDENLQMVFAFNRDFADYDSGKKAVVFKDVDDILIDRIEAKVTEEEFTVLRPGRMDMFPGGGGRGLIKYSLTEKKNA